MGQGRRVAAFHKDCFREILVVRDDHHPPRKYLQYLQRVLADLQVKERSQKSILFHGVGESFVQ
jgi:hypothetical protein